MLFNHNGLELGFWFGLGSLITFVGRLTGAHDFCAVLMKQFFTVTPNMSFPSSYVSAREWDGITSLMCRVK